MCIMSFLVVYFACHFSKNVFVYNATCTMFIVQLFIKCSSFIGGIKVKEKGLSTIVFSSRTASLLIAAMTSSTVLSMRLPPAERVKSLRSGSSQHSNSWITLSRHVTLVALV